MPDDVGDDGLGPVDRIDDLLSRLDSYWTARANTDDEVIVLASTFVDTGMTFTHRVTEEELEREAVDEMPDLSVLLWQRRNGLPLDDGSGVVDVDYTDMGKPRLAGPEDWIEAVRPGDLLVFTRTDGVLSVEVLAEHGLGDGAAEIAALREAARGWIGDAKGEEEVPVVMEAMARNPSLFRAPVPPVGELLVAAGLERRGIEWGWAGEKWQTRQERFKDRDVTVIRRLYGFDGCCDRAFDRVEQAYLNSVSGGEIDGRALVDDLGHGSVAAALVHAHNATPELVVRFARAAADVTSGRHRAPALALLGLALLRSHDPNAAVEALEDAVSADRDLPVAAYSLALLELDRGNLSRGHALAVYDGADPGFVEWIEELRSRESALRPSAGRNDPCPCGSGRKFKRCCAGGGRLTLVQRVPFVTERLAHYATGPDGYDARFGLALSAAAGHDDVVEAIAGFRDDPFIVDVAIHEGGLGEEYADERGPLLAADEVALLEAVLAAPRRLWEITALTPGEALTMRDTSSGDEVTFVEHAGSQDREVGELLLARSATIDGQPMLFGVPIVVPLRERDRVLRMLDGWVDADGLAMWFGSLFLPPRMTNREGEELIARRTTIEIDENDSDDAIAALDGTYERQGDEAVWHDTTLIDHDTVIRGVLRFDGPLLVVESNSEERQDRLLDTLDGLFVDYEILDDTDEDDFEFWDDDLDDFSVFNPDDMPDEVREAVQNQVAEYEQQWVDESIPALGGLTPRQALDDPTRREDLVALLREMRTIQVPEGGFGMSVDRLEKLLGIDSR